MTDKQPSAEKDLLRLIENPGEVEIQKAALPDGQSATKAAAQKKSFFKLFQKKNPKNTPGAKAAPLDRKMILRILFAATLCVFVFFVVTVVREYSRMKDTKKMIKFTYISDGKEAPLAGSKSQDSKPTLNEAVESDIASVRNIFKQGSAKKEEEKRDDTTVVLSDYRLVGISIEPDAAQSYAMVKNVKTNITFFLKKGEQLDGMVIESILDNKLFLNVKGKQVELR